MESLEFEKKINAYIDKISELKKFANDNGLDLYSEIKEMESKLEKLKKETFENLSPWEKLSIARRVERPTALDYIDFIFDDYIEFHGDRNFRDDQAIIGGIAFINDIPVTVIGQQKGRNIKENVTRNFGMPHPEGYRKALRLMKQAEKFKRPVICFVDTPGAFCGVGAEERGQGEAIAVNLLELSQLIVPVISVIIGEGGSGGALAMAVADKIFMLEHSVYSILSPEGFATILWKDSNRAKEAAEVMRMTAQNLLEDGIIDGVIKEPVGGADQNTEETANNIKNELISTLAELNSKDIEQLIDQRYKKFRVMGQYA